MQCNTVNGWQHLMTVSNVPPPSTVGDGAIPIVAVSGIVREELLPTVQTFKCCLVTRSGCNTEMSPNYSTVFTQSIYVKLPPESYL